MSVGAFLIALKETWELLESFEAPVWLWGVVVLVMALLSLGYTVVRIGATRHVVLGDDDRGGRAPRG